MAGALVPFAGQPVTGKGVSYRQGVVVAWDQDTAENLILVGDTVLENLPCLNTSEASLLVPNDVVGILISGSTWAIIGRLIIPGSPEASSSIQSITNRIKAAEDSTDGSRNSTSYGDLAGTAVGPSVSIRVGSSGRVLCFWSAEIGQVVDSATENIIQYRYRITPHVGVQLTGANSVAPDDFHALNFNLEHPGPGFAGEALSSFWGQVAMMHLFTGLNPGDTTFTMKYRHDGINPSASITSSFNAREIAVFAL